MVNSNRYISLSELLNSLELRFREAFRKGHETSWHSPYRECEYLLQRLFRYGVAAPITVSWPADLLPFLKYMIQVQILVCSIFKPSFYRLP